MSGDYKDDIQAIFEELCSERYDTDYWHLPNDVQYQLYREATDKYVERMADRADYLRKSQRENQ